MHLIGLVVVQLINAYLLLLVARMVLSWIELINHRWQPKGFVLVICELIYSITDPPIKALSRFIPPLRLGMIGLDLSFMALFVILIFVRRLAYLFLF